MCFSRIVIAALVAALAGCAAPRERVAVNPGLAPAGYPLVEARDGDDDADEDHDRENARERARAAMNAEYFLMLESDEQGPPTAAQLDRALQQRQAAQQVGKRAGIQPSQWQALGPSNVGGRVRTMAFDPRSPNRLLAGTASGGLWSSNDLGTTWQVDNDFLANLSISTLAFDQGNPSVVYLGTGEASAGLVGFGAYKSTDGGSTWALMPATNVDANPDWRFINRLAVHPSQAGVVLAAMTHNNRTTGAIYRTTDGGASWTKVSSYKALDIAFDPNNPSNALAGLDDGGLAYSTNGGVTWTHTAQLVTPSGVASTARAEIAFAKSQPGVVFASLDNAKGEVWRSSDSGATWARLSGPGHLGAQGDYDNAIWVDPLDASHVIVAGLDIYQSHDGGATFTQVSDWKIAPQSPHADHHVLASPPDYSATRRVLLNGNDGGVYRADDIFRVDTGGGWTFASNGLAVTQFYSGAGATAAGGRIVGGTQDNGSLVLANGSWTRFSGGDGGYVAVDPRGDRTVYGEYVFLAIHRSLNGGHSAYICAGITEGLPNDKDGGNTYCGTDATKKANFISPFILDPNNPDRILGGANSLWVTDNAAAPSPTWRAIKPPSAATDNYINAIAVAPGNANAVWVGHNNGEVYRTANGTSASPTWVRVGQGAIPGRLVQRIVVDPDNNARVIVAVTGFTADNVWETQDNGATWRSITGNLPQAPVFDVKRHPQRADWLYAATSVGLFTSENRGQSWSTTNEGPANIRIRELFWIDPGTLGAATYGRGMFKIGVNAAMSSYQDLWWGGESESGWGLAIAHHGTTLFGALYIYDNQGHPTWLSLPGGSWDASLTTFTAALYSPTGSYFGAYDASRFSSGAAVGQASIRFTSLDTAVLTYTINGVSGTKTITRTPFGVPDATPVASFGDLWWGGDSQNGWGVTIAQQYRTLFIAWYSYDAQGKPTWFVIPGGTWNSASSFTGRAYRASGVPWTGVAFNSPGVHLTDVGSITLDFQDLDHATFTYTIDGVTQSKPLSRFAF